jgi:hypothetical protein
MLTDSDLSQFVSAFNAHHGDKQDPLLCLYACSIEILRYFLGIEWVHQHVFRGTETSFFKANSDAEVDRFKHQDRVVALAEMLFNFQRIDGIESRMEKRRTADVETAVAEFEGAKLLFRSGPDFTFVQERGVRSADYDIDVFLGSETVACEMKCKLESTTLTEATVRNTLDIARGQLPPDRPGVIFIKLPTSWPQEPNATALIRGALDAAFSKTRRISAVVLHWEEWSIELGQGAARVVRFRPEHNPRARLSWPDATQLKSYGEGHRSGWKSLAGLIAPSTMINVLVTDPPAETVGPPKGLVGPIRYGDFVLTLAQYGIRRAHIESTLRIPHRVQHLISPHQQIVPDAGLSLYTRIITPAGGGPVFTLLVEVRMEDKSAVVLGAWRVYHDVIDHSRLQTPLDLLRAFANVYGLPLSIGSLQRAKFYYYEVVPASKGVNLTDLVKVHAAQDAAFEVHSIVRPLAQGII